MIRMEGQPARKKSRLEITDFFAEADCHTDEGNEQSAFMTLLPTAKPKEDLRPEPEEISETSSSLSTKGAKNAHDYPACWNAEQCSYFRRHTVGCFRNGNVGCSVCRSMKILVCFLIKVFTWPMNGLDAKSEQQEGKVLHKSHCEKRS